jgi:hypothetical protein
MEEVTKKMKATVALTNLQTQIPAVVREVEALIDNGQVYISKKTLENQTSKGFLAFWKKYGDKIEVVDTVAVLGNRGGKIQTALDLTGGDESSQLVKLIRQSVKIERAIQDELDKLSPKRRYTCGFIRGVDQNGNSTWTPKDKRSKEDSQE